MGITSHSTTGSGNHDEDHHDIRYGQLGVTSPRSSTVSFTGNCDFLTRTRNMETNPCLVKATNPICSPSVCCDGRSNDTKSRGGTSRGGRGGHRQF